MGLLMARNRVIEWLADPLVGLRFRLRRSLSSHDFIPLVSGSKACRKFCCVACLYLSGDYRDLTRCPVGQPAVHVVGDAARQRTSEPVSARDLAGVLSAHSSPLSASPVPVGLITTFTAEMVAGGRRDGGDVDLLPTVL